MKDKAFAAEIQFDVMTSKAIRLKISSLRDTYRLKLSKKKKTKKELQETTDATRNSMSESQDALDTKSILAVSTSQVPRVRLRNRRKKEKMLNYEQQLTV
ncbi:hypothetical protein HNY73_019251 [Argiope bruennichi]|uniref:Uncharacterized protein n=1 Tax=Argiope bruennichi TaxID=94029 RepID=A0A8T0EGZ4_ARGBR|nr:hypothetical protein HNY73_019251 [Argiope bruennichi]